MAGTAWAELGTPFGTQVPKPCPQPQRRSRLGNVALLVFLLAQFVDGIFTYIGVATFGIGAEANPIVAGMMTHLGHGAGLLGAKLTAGMLGICLHMYEIDAALAILTGFYLMVAITPWALVLFF